MWLRRLYPIIAKRDLIIYRDNELHLTDKFKQYIPNKRHKFGIKLFKLCEEGGYIYRCRVYCGDKDQTSVATKVVMALMADLVGKGCTLLLLGKSLQKG